MSDVFPAQRFAYDRWVEKSIRLPRGAYPSPAADRGTPGPGRCEWRAGRQRYRAIVREGYQVKKYTRLPSGEITRSLLVGTAVIHLRERSNPG